MCWRLFLISHMASHILPGFNFGVWTPKQRNCPSCLPLLLTRSITRSRVTLHSPAHLPHPLPLLLSASISTRVSPDVTLQSRASVWCAHCLVHCWCNAGALPPPPPLPFYCPSPSPSPHPPPTPRHHTRRCGPYHRIAAAEAAAAPPQSTFASKSPRASGCLPHTAAGAALHCTTRNYAEAIEQPPTTPRPAGYHPPWPARHRRRRRHRRRGDRRPAGCHRP